MFLWVQKRLQAEWKMQLRRQEWRLQSLGFDWRVREKPLVDVQELCQVMHCQKCSCLQLNHRSSFMEMVYSCIIMSQACNNNKKLSKAKGKLKWFLCAKQYHFFTYMMNHPLRLKTVRIFYAPHIKKGGGDLPRVQSCLYNQWLR